MSRWPMRKLTQLIFITVISAMASGCIATQTKPIRPAKPVISASECSPGLVCFSKDHAARLATYIIELESGYE